MKSSINNPTQYNLIVDDFGKIRHAELQIKPLTLLVGDNNSGKSYLMSLAWAFKRGVFSEIIMRNYKKILYRTLFYKKIQNIVIAAEERNNIQVELDSESILRGINSILHNEKDKIVSSLFNCEDISIGELQVDFINKFTMELRLFVPAVQKSEYDQKITILINGQTVGQIIFPRAFDDYQFVQRALIDYIFQCVFGNGRRSASIVYLPAGRTGLMITKDSINEIGRKNTFDIRNSNDEYVQKSTPFPKTVLAFFDDMETQSLNTEPLYSSIIEWINENMISGSISVEKKSNVKVLYSPNGKSVKLPLRAMSAVVSEISPLLVLLNNGNKIDTIFYEEPEMCLHPHLQYQMARLLVRMANQGIDIVATTHSDIMIQHINNMCRINKITKNERINTLLKNIEIEKQDLIEIDRVSIYQFENTDEFSVEKIVPRLDFEYQIHTFSNALRMILEKTEEIYEFVESESVQ